MSQQKFLQTLFNYGEQTCFGKSPFETDINDTPWDGFFDNDGDIFFSINPMHTSRADANVTAFRNILLECDNMPLDQQIAYIQHKVPITSIVYSGGKSYHFIISLAESCSTKEEYDQLVRRLHAYLPEVDPTTKNPSRFSRLPDVIRPDTNKLQELVYLGSRTPRATLESILPALEVPKTHDKPPAGFFNPLVVDSMFYPDAVMVKTGIHSRNQFFFWLGQRLLDSCAPFEQRLQIIETTYAALKNKRDFSLQEARIAGRVCK